MCTISFLLVGIKKTEILRSLNTIVSPSITYSLQQLFALWIVELRIENHSAPPSNKELLISRVQDYFSENIIAFNETNLSIIVGQHLRRRGETISTAESCTAGKIASWLADIPGSSSYLMEGAIVYSNQSKTRLCGVPSQMIAQYGAVSSQVAIALSEGILTRSHTDWALAVTGIAGPGGGSAQKPVGTVHISCSSAYGTKERRFLFSGDRQEIRDQTATQALVLLLENILEVDRYSSRNL